MAEEESLKVNPNRADEETLQQLPGVGPALAGKIIQARPFAEVEDLENIQGLGKVILGRMEPFLVFEESVETQQDSLQEEVQYAEMPTEVQPSDAMEKTIISSDGQREDDLNDSQPVYEAEEDMESKPVKGSDEGVEEKDRAVPVTKPRLVRAFSRTETIWLVAAAGILALMISVLVNLAILGGINGTLDFNKLQAVEQLNNDLSALEGSLEGLSSDIDAFDQRLAPLEGLSGRMTSVEDQVDTLQGDVQDALANVEMMQSDLENISNETARLSGRVDRFDTFLEGIRRLISEIFAAPAPDELPES